MQKIVNHQKMTLAGFSQTGSHMLIKLILKNTIGMCGDFVSYPILLLNVCDVLQPKENPGKYMSPSKQMQFQDLNDVFSPSESENQDPVKTTTLESFGLGGGSRFLKKTSKDATGDRLSSAPTGSPAGTDEFKFIPQHSSQSAALSRLALIENRIRNQKSKNDSPSIHTNFSEPQETRLSVESSSDPSMTGSHFLKKRTVTAPQEQVPERTSGLNERKERRDSLDSDEQDMRRLLGDSFSLSEGSLQNAVRQKSPQPVKRVFRRVKSWLTTV